MHANGVDFARLDDFKAAVAVIVVVGQAGQSRTDAGVDVGVVGQQAFGVRVVEVRAVVDGCLLGGGAAEDFGFPRVAVGGVSWGVLLGKRKGRAEWMGRTDGCRSG